MNTESKVSPGARFSTSDYAIIRRAIDEIPESQRVVVYLRFWRNLDPIEIAEVLGVHLRTVEMQLSGAYSALRRLCIADPQFSRTVQTVRIHAA
ncbi:MAG: RNA polymerase sigma factor [Bdellovibrionota bacterium]